jgi:Uma2 family endonuclease
VAPEGTSYRCFPDEPGKVRRADCSFHVLSRLTVERATSEGHCTIVPDLVVEVVSPNDLAYEVDEKRLEWLEAGARLVWIIHPVRQNIHAYYADRTVRLFGKTDLLTAEPVLPEFSIPVADLFRLPV